MVCSVAGITSDANVLTNELRLIGQRYLLQYGESIPCEQLVSWLCDVKQAYTQYGGKYLELFCVFVYNTFNISQVNVHLVFPFYTWAGINITDINSISLIRLETTVAGKQPVLETTVR